MKGLSFIVVALTALVALLFACLFSGACHCGPDTEFTPWHAVCKEIVDCVATGVVCISVLARALCRGRWSLCPLLAIVGMALAATGLCFGMVPVALAGIAVLEICILVTSALEILQAADDLRRAQLRVSHKETRRQ